MPLAALPHGRLGASLEAFVCQLWQLPLASLTDESADC
jgi:hypothetical protein